MHYTYVLFTHQMTNRGHCKHFGRFIFTPKDLLHSKRTPSKSHRKNNKTGTSQYTRAVWSTFAEIHSIHPGALMHYLGLIYWDIRLEFMMPHTSQHTRDLPNLSYDSDL